MSDCRKLLSTPLRFFKLGVSGEGETDGLERGVGSGSMWTSNRASPSVIVSS